MTVSAPRRLSFSNFSSEEDVAITRAPAAFANCSANSDTPPVPRISTVSPGFTWPHTTRPLQAVTPAQVSVAASTCVRSEEHTSELQSQSNLVCRLLLEKKNKHNYLIIHSHGVAIIVVP